MKRLLLLVCASAMLVAPFRAQTPGAQTQNDLTIPEFRQVLLDLGSYLDAHKGTNIRGQFEAIPDEIARRLYPAVANPRRFQSAVAALKEHDAAVASGRLTSGPGTSIATFDSHAAFPSCPANTIIDTSTGSTCTPAYPDSTNSTWRAMAGALIPVGAFSGVPAEIPTAADYASASQEGCSVSTEVSLEQVQATLNGIVDVGQFICAALVPPDPLAIACYVAAAAIGAAGETDAGLYTDCIEQDGLVNAAEIDAGFHNTVTIYNALKSANTQINTEISSLDTHLTNVDTDVDTRIGGIGTQIGNVNTQITGEFTALDTHVTNVDNHIANEFSALDAHLVTLISQLSNQVSQGTALLDSDLRQVMKLLLTPDGQKVINPLILTCSGTNCPNVLANCPKAGCSWNNAGPLP